MEVEIDQPEDSACVRITSGSFTSYVIGMFSKMIFSSTRICSSLYKTSIFRKKPENFSKLIFQESPIFTNTGLRFLSTGYDNSATHISNSKLGIISLGLAGVAGLFGYGIYQSVTNKTDSWSPELRRYLRTSYLYVLAGAGTACSTCCFMLKNNPEFMMNPAFAFGSFFVSMGLIFFTNSLSYDRSFLLKNASFLSLCALIGMTFTPAAQFLGPEVLIRAAMLTSGVTAGVSLAGICAPDEKFLWLGGPLFMGLLALIGIQFASILFPQKMSRIHNMTIYPAIGLFSLMLLFDTQYMIYHGKMSVTGRVPYDPIHGAMKTFITITNLFSSILSSQRRK